MKLRVTSLDVEHQKTKIDLLFAEMDLVAGDKSDVPVGLLPEPQCSQLKELGRKVQYEMHILFSMEDVEMEP